MDELPSHILETLDLVDKNVGCILIVNHISKIKKVHLLFRKENYLNLIYIQMMRYSNLISKNFSQILIIKC